MLKGYSVDVEDKATWKYYLNLFGEYHESDTMMTVLSKDTQAEINFTKDNLVLHPRTRKEYRPGTQGYRDLCVRYPEQTDLIKNIMYPVSSISDAIDAYDFDLLAYGSEFLEPTELSSVIDGINEFLTYAVNRWYHSWMTYEPYYPIAFWGSLWQHLYAVVEVVRHQNIRTARVHTYHVWQYLTSQGIGDYRDILSRRQALSLYRNMNYIRLHRGQRQNLILLVNELLTEHSVTMTVKSIEYQITNDNDDYRRIPEMVSTTLNTLLAGTVQEVEPASVSSFLSTLRSQGLDPNSGAEHLERTSRQIEATRAGYLPTKFMEIRPVLKNDVYQNILHGFVLDNLARIAQTDKASYLVEITDPHTGVKLNITMAQLMLLYGYAVQRSIGVDIVDLPDKYTPVIGTFKPDLALGDVDVLYTYEGHQYRASRYTDPELFIEGAKPYVANYISVDDTVTDIVGMFMALTAQLDTIRRHASLPAIDVLNQLQRACLDMQTFELTLSGDEAVTTYEDWIPTVDNLSSMIATYEASGEYKALYDTLSTELLRAAVPDNHPLISPLLDDVTTNESFYRRLKALFVQLCSYGVTFLDTVSSRNIWSLSAGICWDDTDATASHGVVDYVDDIISAKSITCYQEMDAGFETLIPEPVSQIVRVEDELETPVTIEAKSLTGADAIRKPYAPNDHMTGQTVTLEITGPDYSYDFIAIDTSEG
jgi:hypothetical protein